MPKKSKKNLLSIGVQNSIVGCEKKSRHDLHVILYITQGETYRCVRRTHQNQSGPQGRPIIQQIEIPDVNNSIFYLPEK